MYAMTKYTKPPRFVDAVNRDDVRVRQSRGHLRFANELLAAFRRCGEFRRQHLDRDFAREPNLARQIHDAHAAPAEFPLERVLARERRLKLDEKGVWGGHLGGRGGGRRTGYPMNPSLDLQP